MEVLGGILAIIVIIFFLKAIGRGGSQTFDDPKPMTDQHLLSAIAGQADWLEKMSRSPIETQQSASIVELARKRRGYIAQLCLEACARADRDDGRPMYLGATRSTNAFTEAADYAKELAAKGVSGENAAVRAVKEKMFIPSGVIYSSHWES
ncbi:hypothetical protein ETQ85_14725 [Zoogloea oleivorans]|uniref:Uncharacterized protein n=1 Tax=Zoogloea oleivorans TaxID=1552750 RepID=A0A6C2CNF8_9RHOO|nr:hypothetical protein [Zoogloea oleivorans]TYC55266.1 hypothetical protein ETQ85_14725 [Zoogloea oleivorans]